MALPDDSHLSCCDVSRRPRPQRAERRLAAVVLSARCVLMCVSLVTRTPIGSWQCVLISLGAFYKLQKYVAVPGKVTEAYSGLVFYLAVSADTGCFVHECVLFHFLLVFIH